MTSALPLPHPCCATRWLGLSACSSRDQQTGTHWEEVLHGCHVVQDGKPQRDRDCRSKALEMPRAQPVWEHLGVLWGLEGGYPPNFGCLTERVVQGDRRGAYRDRRVVQGDQRVTKEDRRVAYRDRRVVQEYRTRALR